MKKSKEQPEELHVGILFAKEIRLQSGKFVISSENGYPKIVMGDDSKSKGSAFPRRIEIGFMNKVNPSTKVEEYTPYFKVEVRGSDGWEGVTTDVFYRIEKNVTTLAPEIYFSHKGLIKSQWQVNSANSRVVHSVYNTKEKPKGKKAK